MAARRYLKKQAAIASRALLYIYEHGILSAREQEAISTVRDLCWDLSEEDK